MEMFHRMARRIERLFNPDAWKRYELDCDLTASAAALSRFHDSPGWMLSEMARLGSLPNGVLSISGSDSASVTAYLDVKITSIEQVLGAWSKEGLFLTMKQ
jgi:hypothetical protein